MSELKIDKLIKSHRKTISIEISFSGELIVRVPSQISNSSVISFLKDKTEWIIEKKKEAESRKNTLNEELFFMGTGYGFEIVEFDSVSVELNDKFIIKKPNSIPVKKIMKKWYLNQAIKILMPMLKSKSMQYGFTYKSSKVTCAEHRWGSCNAKKNINFSYKLVMLPKEVIDYVIIHELAHTVELNHSKKYWSLVRDVMPDYVNYERWLKNNAFKFCYIDF